MDEATFWRARYLELLQNHTQIVALMAKRDQQIEQTQKLNDLGAALKDRVEQGVAANGQSTWPQTGMQPQAGMRPDDSMKTARQV